MDSRALLQISKAQIARNFELFLADKPARLKFMAVVKNKGIGVGISFLAETALKYGADYVAVACLEEARLLADKNMPLMILGERADFEIAEVAKYDATIQVQSLAVAENFAAACLKYGRQANVHLKIDTGLGRYGVKWQEADLLIRQLLTVKNLKLRGIMTHFAMSDEADKSYANLQWQRFTKVVQPLRANLPPDCLIHACNSGGYLDLPMYHADMCRIGVLFTGNYPSAVCRRITVAGEPLQSALTLKSRLAFIKQLQPGDHVGYGMHYQAKRKLLAGVVPIGYGDGYPRLRNKGEVIIEGVKVKIIGSVAMDNLMVDLTPLSNVKVGTEVVLLGRQAGAEIFAYDLGRQAETVVYDILTAWQPRLEVAYV